MLALVVAAVGVEVVAVQLNLNRSQQTCGATRATTGFEDRAGGEQAKLAFKSLPIQTFTTTNYQC